MIRRLLYGIILIALLAAPVQKLDIAKLEPVEVVSVEYEEETVILQTDTGAWGRGRDANSALEDMRQRTPGVIYLDTAEYLVVSPEAIGQLQQLRPLLKPGIKLCCAENVDLETAAALLEIHGDLPRLQQWKEGEKLPQIRDGKIIE